MSEVYLARSGGIIGWFLPSPIPNWQQTIDAALFRMEWGPFGVFDVCIQDAPTPLLNAVPWAQLRGDCDETWDGGESRQATISTAGLSSRDTRRLLIFRVDRKWHRFQKIADFEFASVRIGACL
jgi:hypothetical protein